MVAGGTVYCKYPVLLGDEAAYGAQLEALLSGAGSTECVVAECELLLKQSQLAQRLPWLVRLYESHGQHERREDTNTETKGNALIHHRPEVEPLSGKEIVLYITDRLQNTSC